MQVTRFLKSALFQSVFYAVLTKGVGSGYRFYDDRHAPEHIRKNTLKRESILMGLVTAASVAINLCISPLFARVHRLKGMELILRGLATAPAFLFAEYVSRKTAPKLNWQKTAYYPMTRFGNPSQPPSPDNSGKSAGNTYLRRSPVYNTFGNLRIG